MNRMEGGICTLTLELLPCAKKVKLEKIYMSIKGFSFNHVLNTLLILQQEIDCKTKVLNFVQESVVRIKGL